ncbi:hypothetical protein M569_15624 [Genlisea aurea]|uniref:Uncharacterized protein n=1 Tax=Genlisea aurea TaxID=192259 RepID=S8C428_9LAMI|nr:hypothetical protein M569_15624 [Genlisea aurea]
MNLTEPEERPVLVPAGNKSRSVDFRKPVKKEKEKDSSAGDDAKGKKFPSPAKLPEIAAERVPSGEAFGRNRKNACSILKCRQNNMSASCSSDASTDSSHSKASTGRIIRQNSAPARYLERRRQRSSTDDEKLFKILAPDAELSGGGGHSIKKRCAWITSNTDPLYAAFHDQEWGIPIHDDKKLFELFSYSTALAELTWPAILARRHIFRAVFSDFDPVAVSKLQDRKISAPGCPASSLLSEMKLRSIVENARQVCKVIDECGSFDSYVWGFVGCRPILCNFRYVRQVPIKTSKAETISKDLVRRGFRGVGPTAVYSFMQAAGITNDHLVNCFRHQDCILAAADSNVEEKDP